MSNAQAVRTMEEGSFKPFFVLAVKCVANGVDNPSENLVRCYRNKSASGFLFESFKELLLSSSNKDLVSGWGLACVHKGGKSGNIALLQTKNIQLWPGTGLRDLQFLGLDVWEKCPIT